MNDWTRYIVLMVLLQFAGAVESSGQESSWLRNGTMWYYNYHEGMDDPRSGFIKCVISGDTIVEDSKHRKPK